jgi:hypothetical protein
MTAPAPKTIEREREKLNRLSYPPPWMDAPTLAAHLSICVDTVESWSARGILPPARKRGGKNMWKWSEVDHMLTMGRVGADPDPEAERLRNASRSAA